MDIDSLVCDYRTRRQCLSNYRKTQLKFILVGSGLLLPLTIFQFTSETQQLSTALMAFSSGVGSMLILYGLFIQFIDIKAAKLELKKAYLDLTKKITTVEHIKAIEHIRDNYSRGSSKKWLTEIIDKNRINDVSNQLNTFR